jgi:hypothetical protein
MTHHAKTMNDGVLSCIERLLQAEGPGEFRFYERPPGQPERLLVTARIAKIERDAVRGVLRLIPEGAPVRFTSQHTITRTTWACGGKEVEFNLFDFGRIRGQGSLTCEIEDLTIGDN